MTNIVLYSISLFLIYKLFVIVKSKLNKNIIGNLLLLSLALWIVIFIIIYPENSVKSALNGLNTWFNIVLPSLLPFFIISELLVSLGVVDFISVLLEPITTLLFNVPGQGSFVFAMSVTSGYPVGAKLISTLRLNNKISKAEGQRLLSFCSTSGPLFMIGAVSVGMFKNPSIGPLIAVSHYLGALTIGIIFRFYKPVRHKRYVYKVSSIKNAFEKLLGSNKKDNKSFGTLMSDSVKSAINTMLVVGGFIILYSVVIEVFYISNAFDYISKAIIKVIPSFSDVDLLKALLSGFVEITIGCNNISLLHSSNYIIKVAMASLLIGWSGLSIHSQVLSFISKTDLSMTLYIISKALHGLLASVYTLLLFKYFVVSDIPTINTIDNPNNLVTYLNNWMYYFKFSIKIISISLIIIILIGILISIFTKKK